jgi:uncharacterized protein (TIGR02757 family)
MKYLEYITIEERKKLLDELLDKYNRKSFILDDPIAIPHRFTKKEDREIAGFLCATIAWGQRAQIVKNGFELMDMMDNAPFDFVLNSGEKELVQVNRFYYRTFKYVDLEFFIRVLRHIYNNLCGLEGVFSTAYKQEHSIVSGLIGLYKVFGQIKHEKRSMKHLANVQNGASAKRLNMFLRWMIRKDNRGVDFGLWRDIPPSALFIPLDVHSGRSARDLGLLSRKQNDWKAVVELTEALRGIDPVDPVKYDFALFGVGVDNMM